MTGPLAGAIGEGMSDGIAARCKAVRLHRAGDA
jgi:hypothetical protein